MHKFTLLAAAALSGTLILSGCGNFGKNADKPNREDAALIHEKEKAGGSLETGDGYGFTSFDLDIEVDGKDAIEADYKVGKQLEADYDNKLTNIKLTDSAAMDELDKLFMDILITKDTPPQEVIDKILKWYQLETYSKFDLEVDFDDGTRLDIEEIQ
ncbi:YusW family protein [Sporosarcina sp. YIM B06819]|uniref:YusW family protein n=1 Tax=Sporosarcina sp. YIM B06819 TaxID=3081769 RepID=UPI00298CA960|nr:YusW family protein [Sporosarcina sp. YIM B06819]